MHESVSQMSKIAKSAIISPDAKLGENNIIKDWVVIEDDVEIGNNNVIHYNAQIEQGARLGNNIRLFKGACLSTEPHDLKFGGEKTYTYIGDNTVIREFTTISRGTIAKGKTVIGKNCYIMAYAHIAHDSIIGDNVIMANSTNLGGHVTIEDWAIIGGIVGIHQFTRIGRHSFTAFLSRISQDVPPYILAAGNPLSYKGLNIVGLRRRGFTDEQIESIKNAYKFIYSEKYNTTDALKAIRDSIEMTQEVRYIVEFIENSERGIIRG